MRLWTKDQHLHLLSINISVALRMSTSKSPYRPGCPVIYFIRGCGVWVGLDRIVVEGSKNPLEKPIDPSLVLTDCVGINSFYLYFIYFLPIIDR